MSDDIAVWKDRAIKAANQLLLKEEQLKVATGALVMIKRMSRSEHAHETIARKALTDMKEIEKELKQCFGKGLV